MGCTSRSARHASHQGLRTRFLPAPALTKMLLIFALLFVSAGLAHAQGEGTDYNEFDFYDAGNLHEFIINCGTVAEKFMRITYGGAAHRMYADPNLDGCQAVEMAPAVWQIYIEDYENTECPVVADNMGGIGDPNLMTLNVVVQRGLVRKMDDPYKQIICNYGLGGQTDTNQTATAIAGEAVLDPIWRNANTEESDDIVDLYVYDASSNRVDTVELGDYIQLRAHLQSGEGELENSIRVFNCRVFAEDYTSYYFMLEGCGKGDGVMASDRGFRTRPEDTGDSKITRVSRSSYFKSFAIPGHLELTFECHYILCPPEECDEYSCAQSVMLATNQSRAEPPSPSTRGAGAGARRKRDVSAPTSKYDQLPKIRSNKITLLQPEEPEILLTAEDLVYGRSERSQERPQGTNTVPKSSRLMQRMNYEPEVEAREPVIEEGLDLITIGLIAGMAFLALLLLITLVCTYVACHRSMKLPHYRTERNEQLLYPQSTGFDII